MPDMREINRQVIQEFRASGGRVGGQLANTPLLLLTTTGARSGRPHTTPLMYLPDGGRFLVFASVMGAPRHPDWYRNLVANPSVSVEVDGRALPATAAVLDGPERERLWATAVERYPFLAEHQARAGRRRIPVVALEPRA
ncbi:MAG TPA: nitroreductase/quinone reductase family protein [Dehalococcoidia bacterium]